MLNKTTNSSSFMKAERTSFPFKYSKFKVNFYSKIKFDDDTRKLIKFLNSMQQ